MERLRLTLREELTLPLEAEVICPDVLIGKTIKEIKQLLVYYGNKSYPLKDFFQLEGVQGEVFELAGDLRKVKRIGEGMSCGSIVISGDVGMHLGSKMTGGKITLWGKAGDWLGAEMKGGYIEVHGDAGNYVGAAYRGSTRGLDKGVIIIKGSCGNMVGEFMTRGIIAVLGDVGDYAGCMMKGGTIIIFGKSQQRIGGGMKRGTILCLQKPELLPTFHYNCTYSPGFLPLIWSKLKSLGVEIADKYTQASYLHYSGDSSELGKGEIIIYDQYQ